MLCLRQEQQAATAAAAAEQLPVLLGLLAEVVAEPLAKAQQQGEALKSGCAIVEALRRLLPPGSFSGEAAAAGPGRQLSEAVHAALHSSAAPPSGKVRLCSIGVRGCNALEALGAHRQAMKTAFNCMMRSCAGGWAAAPPGGPACRQGAGSQGKEGNRSSRGQAGRRQEEGAGRPCACSHAPAKEDQEG